MMERELRCGTRKKKGEKCAEGGCTCFAARIPESLKEQDKAGGVQRTQIVFIYEVIQIPTHSDTQDPACTSHRGS